MITEKDPTIVKEVKLPPGIGRTVEVPEAERPKDENEWFKYIHDENERMRKQSNLK